MFLQTTVKKKYKRCFSQIKGACCFSVFYLFESKSKHKASCHHAQVQEAIFSKKGICDKNPMNCLRSQSLLGLTNLELTLL